MTNDTHNIKAILFDKDGTLFDFNASWSSWALGVIERLSADDSERLARLSDVLGFDVNAQSFLPESPVIAGTLEETSALIASVLTERTQKDIAAHLVESAAQNALAPVRGLKPLLSGLREKGLKLAVITNDSIAPTRHHLQKTGIDTLFDFIAAADSGFTPKPAPDALLAFAHKFGLAPENCVMVGDSLHDLIAGQKAGMKTIGVLTGIATRRDLAPYSTAVMEDISGLTSWLG